MTAATFVGATTAQAQGTTITSTAPAGTLAGDHQLFIFTCGTGSETLGATPTDLVQIGAEQAQTTDTAKARIYKSTAATGNVAFTKSGSRLGHVVRLVWRGGSGFLDATALFQIQAASTSHAFQSQTTTVADQIVVGACWADAGLATTMTFTGPAGWNQRFNASATTTLPERSTVGVWDITRATPGAQAGTVTTSLSEDAMVFSIQLAQATAGGTAPVVDAGPDVASHTVSTQFSRTATETGSGITARGWTIVSGPAGAGTTIGTAAALAWTPTAVGTYVLRYSATNATGTGVNDVSVTVVAGGGGPAPVTSIVHQNAALSVGSFTPSVSLGAAPATGALVLSVFSGNKQVASIAPPASFIERAEYRFGEVSGALADGTSDPGAWTLTGTAGTHDYAAVGAFETNITGWSHVAAAAYPNPPDSLTVTSVAGDLGTAAVSGTVFALVGVDSAYLDVASPWTRGSTVAWTNGFTEVGRIIQANNDGSDGVNAAGVAFILAKRDVAVGDSMATTVSWSGGTPASIADQAFLILSQYQVTATSTPGGTPGTLTSSWLGVDAINLVLAGGSGDVRVDFSSTSDMASPTSSVNITPDALGNARVPLPALAADTALYYRPYRGGSLIGTAQAFRTLPSSGSFTFAFASCRNHTGDAPAMSTMAGRGVDLFLQIGDLHYRDYNTNSPANFRTGYDEVATRPIMAGVLKSIPTSYVWDDHDYGGNASTGSTASKPAANLVYRERVPHTTLPVTDGVYHTFKVARARFIVLDCRSFRDSIGSNADGTMLGATQKAWFQNLLATADTPVTFVISPVGWHSSGSDDDWGFYQNERTELAGNITASSTEVVMLCGDMHRLAVATPANGTPGSVHVWHAAPLNQSDNSIKGGPYADTYYGASQYGLVTVDDIGTGITASFTGVRDGLADWATTDSVTVATPTTDPATSAFLPFFV